MSLLPPLLPHRTERHWIYSSSYEIICWKCLSLIGVQQEQNFTKKIFQTQYFDLITQGSSLWPKTVLRSKKCEVPHIEKVWCFLLQLIRISSLTVFLRRPRESFLPWGTTAALSGANRAQWWADKRTKSLLYSSRETPHPPPWPHPLLHGCGGEVDLYQVDRKLVKPPEANLWSRMNEWMKPTSRNSVLFHKMNTNLFFTNWHF